MAGRAGPGDRDRHRAGHGRPGVTVRRADWRVARAEASDAAQALPRDLETVLLADAVGRTLARDATSLARVPGSDVSAMDGWAV
ncbi:molybdopterin molybdenumtransferase MoeA, partial [Frigoribacterium sp. CFBP 13605]|nr:molybdopterin molybdenumtransferase MoeA [Frigoribacterium sp. CFBP 13605]